MTGNSESFKSWAVRIYKENPEIVRHMYEGSDPFEKAIVSMILKAVGEDKTEEKSVIGEDEIHCHGDAGREKAEPFMAVGKHD